MQTPIVDNLKTYFTMYFDNLIRLYTYNYIHYNIDKCKPQYLYYKKDVRGMMQGMSENELKQVTIDYYVNLQRIKKAETGNNPELDYQIKVVKNKLASLGIPSEEYEM